MKNGLASFAEGKPVLTRGNFRTKNSYRRIGLRNKGFKGLSVGQFKSLNVLLEEVVSLVGGTHTEQLRKNFAVGWIEWDPLPILPKHPTPRGRWSVLIRFFVLQNTATYDEIKSQTT